LSELAKGPCASFVGMDGVLLEVCNRKGRMSHLESCCYNESDPSPKALTSPNLDERKSFLVCFEALLDFPKY
jgi:hypothetical protein